MRDFHNMYKNILPRIRYVAFKVLKNRRDFFKFIDERDLVQEMSLWLWEKYPEGVPENFNDAYIVNGCEYFIRNYLRKITERKKVVSLDAILDDSGHSFVDLIPDDTEPVYERLDRELLVSDIKEERLNPKEKDVLNLSLQGYTCRQIGDKLRMSHVMVVKYRKRIYDKCKDSSYHKERIFT